MRFLFHFPFGNIEFRQFVSFYRQCFDDFRVTLTVDRQLQVRVCLCRFDTSVEHIGRIFGLQTLLVLARSAILGTIPEKGLIKRIILARLAVGLVERIIFEFARIAFVKSFCKVFGFDSYPRTPLLAGKMFRINFRLYLLVVFRQFESHLQRNVVATQQVGERLYEAGQVEPFADIGFRFGKSLRDTGDAPVFFLGVTTENRRLFERGEVGTLHILRHGTNLSFLVGHGLYVGRNTGLAGSQRRPVPTFPIYDFVSVVVYGTHFDRCLNTITENTVCQLGQRRLGNLPAGIQLAGDDLFQVEIQKHSLERHQRSRSGNGCIGGLFVRSGGLNRFLNLFFHGFILI